MYKVLKIYIDRRGIINDEGLLIYKKEGKVAELEETLIGKCLHSNIRIENTRWAKHGDHSNHNAYRTEVRVVNWQ